MPNDKTLAEHLAAARGQRDKAKLREHADRIRRLPRKVKPCNCGRTDGTHAYNCPVYFRQRRRDQKGTGQ